MAVAPMRQLRGFSQLIRFYQAAIINTAFGLGLYALMVWLGINLYVAQIIAQVCGLTFNYFTYTGHVFRGGPSSKMRFLAAYGFNYLFNLAFLALFHRMLSSPYFAGLLATASASLINYLVLKHLVFVSKTIA